ncbi:hypothetical protein C2S53_010914 [Perilla frutescens var. hirtella]|uniref:Uncharacterized protein n=1 Tax=Perilla frutescens var. hirtella TaxID=608512 RepID=A0AAD4J0U7_PERFH|nr:hypothetical protein C2S53_010914 [Perilla frutescens var. hirtella]
MELCSENNLWKFMDEERKSINLPRRFSFGNNAECPDSQLSSARASCASAASFPLWKMSPETPWTRSPMVSSPSPPLLYHCIAARATSSLSQSRRTTFSPALTAAESTLGSSRIARKLFA